MDLVTRFRIWYAAQPRALRALLTINVVAYLVWQVFLVHFDATFAFVRNHLALHTDLPGIFYEPWQLITYNFLHLDPGLGGFLHILFNMLWLVWVGRDFEHTHGPERHLSIYLLAGVGGGLLSVLLNLAFPGGFFRGPIVGASASVLGVVSAVAFMYPRRTIGLLFIGNVRLVHLVIAFLALDILFLAGSRSAVGAHLGGVLTGLLYARATRAGVNVHSWASVFFARPGARRHRGEREPFMERLEAWLGRKSKSTRSARITPLHPNPREEAAPEAPGELDVDRILDKISEKGYEALTDDEKRALYEASQK